MGWKIVLGIVLDWSQKCINFPLFRSNKAAHISYEYTQTPCLLSLWLYFFLSCFCCPHQETRGASALHRPQLWCWKGSCHKNERACSPARGLMRKTDSSPYETYLSFWTARDVAHWLPNIQFFTLFSIFTHCKLQYCRSGDCELLCCAVLTENRFLIQRYFVALSTQQIVTPPVKSAKKWNNTVRLDSIRTDWSDRWMPASAISPNHPRRTSFLMLDFT